MTVISPAGTAIDAKTGAAEGKVLKEFLWMHHADAALSRVSKGKPNMTPLSLLEDWPPL
jgi:hypothetical protein